MWRRSVFDPPGSFAGRSRNPGRRAKPESWRDWGTCRAVAGSASGGRPRDPREIQNCGGERGGQPTFSGQFPTSDNVCYVRFGAGKMRQIRRLAASGPKRTGDSGKRPAKTSGPVPRQRPNGSSPRPAKLDRDSDSLRRLVSGWSSRGCRRDRPVWFRPGYRPARPGSLPDPG